MEELAVVWDRQLYRCVCCQDFYEGNRPKIIAAFLFVLNLVFVKLCCVCLEVQHYEMNNMLFGISVIPNLL